MDLQDGSGSETSEQSLQKLQSETDILAVTGVSCLLCYSWTMEYEAECDSIWDIMILQRRHKGLFLHLLVRFLLILLICRGTEQQ